MLQNMHVNMLYSTAAVLTWEHPNNIFDEEYFNYSISVIDVSRGDVMVDRILMVHSSNNPRQLIDVSGLDVCDEVNISLSIVGDIRKNATILPIPICKYIYIYEKL